MVSRARRCCSRLAATRPESRRDPELRGTLLALRTRRPARPAADKRRARARARDREARPQSRPSAARPARRRSAVAAQVVLSWSHPGRLPNEAAFARLAGAAPIPASSGQTIRYRLDRGGDRKLNRDAPPDPHHPKTDTPPDDRLHRTPHQRRQDPPRSNPLPQALPRPQPLPPTRKPASDDLTNIEASFAQPSGVSSERRYA